MKKIITLLILSISTLVYSVGALASVCDGLVLNILNTSNQRMLVSNITSDGASTITTPNTGQASTGFTFQVQSGKGTKGNASGTVTLTYADSPEKKPVDVKYLFYRARNPGDLWLTSTCYVSVDVSLPAYAYQVVVNNNALNVYLND